MVFDESFVVSELHYPCYSAPFMHILRATIVSPLSHDFLFSVLCAFV